MSADPTVKATLKKEIRSLQDQLQDQFMARQILEKALSQKKPYVSDAHPPTNPIPKQAEELINEISVLELEVAYLEKYILSLYRRKFVRQVSEDNDSAATTFRNGENSVIHYSCPVPLRHPITSPLKEHDLVPSILSRSESSLSHPSFSRSNRIFFPPMRRLTECGGSYQSLPLSMLERAEFSGSNTTSLREHFLRSVPDYAWETPNSISEEMIKSISGIYCELAEPTLGSTNHFFCSSSPASLSGQSETFQETEGDVAEVRSISRDRERLKNIEYMLRKYRSLVHRLRRVDPSKMRHEEKLAFWINVHNSLGMHAILVHGNAESKLKRTASLLKAAYDVGGHTISLELLRNRILQCKLPLPGQWLRLFFPSRWNSKVRDVPKEYSIDSPEPLLPFALSSGSYSDPMVRVYRPEKVFKELKAAQEDYVKSNISFRKDNLLVPKLVQNYVKGSGLSTEDLLGIILSDPTTVPDSSSRVRPRPKASKFIEWVPHNFGFRYLLSNELA